MPPSHPWNSWLPLRRSPHAVLTRRRFLQASVAAMSGVALSNCARNLGSNPQSPASPAATASPTDSNTLYIYTWANYTDDELLKDFQAATGITVVVDIYDSNEAMLAKLEAGGASQYSILYPSDYIIVEMIEKGLLAELDQSRLEVLGDMLPQWQNPAYDPNNAHSVPTTWGTTGLIYDPEKLGTNIQGWDYLFDNVDALTRQVTLLNDVREVMAAILLYLGYPGNSTDPEQIEAAYQALVDLKPAIAAFLTNGWEDQLASGDLSISMAYSSDALGLIEENPNLTYIVPETGASLWTDTMAIPKAAPNVDAAYEWINFILTPENSAKLVDRLKFSTPSKAAYDLLSEDLKNNQTLFPPEKVIAKTVELQPVPPEISDLYDRYWTQLTSV